MGVGSRLGFAPALRSCDRLDFRVRFSGRFVRSNFRFLNYLGLGDFIGVDLDDVTCDNQGVGLGSGGLQFDRLARTFPRDRARTDHPEKPFRQSLVTVLTADFFPALRMRINQPAPPPR